MSTSYTYDAAISCVAFDSLTARSLLQQLKPRLKRPVFAAWEHRDGRKDVVSDVLENDARVVVVLHQRLWGETACTRGDQAALETRVERQGPEFLFVVSLEADAISPVWVADADSRMSLADDGLEHVVDGIAEAVRRAGGVTQAATRLMPHLSLVRDEFALTPAHGVATGAYKAASAAQRELRTLIAEIERRVAEARDVIPGVALDMRHTPERCVVQADGVAVSASWLHRAANASDDGKLLVLEWDGTVTFPGEAARAGRHATVVREQVLLLEQAGSDWHWRAEDAPTRQYSSADLAALCVQLLVRRMNVAPTATA
ncbi:MAG: hypothetical protein ACREOJ_13885 [Gemmatimonadaceae bacterium]